LSDNTRPNLPRFRSGYRASGLLLHVIPLPSPAALAMAPLQDILNLGAEARMNIPSRAEGNWSWCSTEKVLSTADFHPLRDLTRSTNRLRMLPSLAIEMAEAVL
jgi:4-alpha-glucanotransferase